MATVVRSFYLELKRLDLSLQLVLFKAGGLYGLFDMHSPEALCSSIPEKRECFEMLTRHGFTKDFLQDVFVNLQVARGCSRLAALHSWDEAMHYYALPADDIARLKDALGHRTTHW